MQDKQQPYHVSPDCVIATEPYADGAEGWFHRCSCGWLGFTDRRFVVETDWHDPRRAILDNAKANHDREAGSTDAR